MTVDTTGGGALCVITARGGSKRIPRKNVREFCGMVNAVAPGPTATGMLLDGDTGNVMKPNSPIGRYVTPEEIASMVVTLLSDASPFNMLRAQHFSGRMRFFARESHGYDVEKRAISRLFVGGVGLSGRSPGKIKSG